MSVTPYKGRSTEHGCYRQVYRNLHTGSWSLKHPTRGLVTGHADRVVLADAIFSVAPRANARVRATGRKEVHAWVDGRVLLGTEESTAGLDRVRYNPMEHRRFVRAEDGTPVTRSPRVVLDADGRVWADCRHLPPVDAKRAR